MVFLRVCFSAQSMDWVNSWSELCFDSGQHFNVLSLVCFNWYWDPTQNHIPQAAL